MDSKKSEYLKSIKDDIKAIVVSSKSQMTVNDLFREYYNIVGKRLSATEFGYKNVQDFLQTECTDILKIHTLRGVPTLCPILKTESGKILNSLILNQKQSKGPITPRKSIITRQTITQNRNVSQNQIKPNFNKPNPTTSLLTGNINKLTLTRKNNESNSTTPPTNKFNEKDKFINEVKKNLQILIGEHRKLNGSELLTMYELKFKNKLNYEKLGYSSVLSLCEGFSEIFRIRKLQKSIDWIIYDQRINYEKEFWSQYEENSEKNKEETRKTSLDSRIFGLEALPYIDIDPSLTPENCIQFGQKINLVSPPLVDLEINIFVAEVIDPSHFWIHLNSPEHNGALESLMTEMDSFYKSDKSAYKMVRALMKPGQYCAVKYSNTYHRAIVLRNISENIIQVRYVDYGTIEEVSTDDVRLLLKKFGELKEQALPARLYGVQPVNHIWSHAARKKFLELTDSRPLSAHVSDIEQENVSCLILMDKSQEMFSVISQILYEEGLAKFISSDKKHWKYIDYLHLLPSFQDLNLGYFPNFTHFERKSDISLLFNKLLSSFCEILNEKVLPDSPQKKNLSDLAVHPMQVPFDQNMNNSSSHNYFNTLPGNTTNYNTALYPPRRFSHEYIQNFPYYDSGKYDLYQQQLETKRSVGMPQSIPEPPYIYPYGNMLDVSHPFIVDDRVVLNGTAIPNVVWANDIPHYSIYDTPIIEREFHRNDFGKHPTVTAMTPLLNNNVQINNTDDRIPRFNEISEDHNIDSQFECQNKIDYHLINELCARNEISDDFKRNSIIEKKLKSNHGYSNDIGSGSVKNNYLKLVDIMSVVECKLEIWTLKYETDVINSSLVLLEQILHYFIKPDHHQSIRDKICEFYTPSELYHVHLNDLSILSNVKTCGISGQTIGECAEFRSMSIEKSHMEENVTLLKLDRIVYFLRYCNLHLKVRYQDIVRDMLPILEKYSKINRLSHT